jgi:hypothetical protein
MTSDEQLSVSNIIDLIEPTPDRVVGLKMRIAEDIELLKRIAGDVSNTPTPATLRKSLSKLASSLRKSKALAAPLSRWIAPVLDGSPDSLAQRLGVAADQIDGLASAIVTSNGSRRWNSTAYAAKLLATNIYREFSSEADARGKTSRCNKIGAILYEIVTGVFDMDLSEYVIHDDRALDRVEPLIRLQLPFAG